MKDRWKTDTNPCIVQMILYRELVPHWYYRSDQWVAQPYFIPQYFLQPYVGPSENAPANMYGKGTYVIDKDATNFAINKIKKGRN